MAGESELPQCFFDIRVASEGGGRSEGPTTIIEKYLISCNWMLDEGPGSLGSWLHLRCLLVSRFTLNLTRPGTCKQVGGYIVRYGGADGEVQIT